MTGEIEGYETLMVCPICWGETEVQKDCTACAGRGTIDNLPYAEHVWDEIVPGLWLGGHDSQQGYGYGAMIDREGFDIVVSMTYGRGEFSPPPHVKHYRLSIADEEQDITEIAEQIDRLATGVNAHLALGEKVLVRCWAGLNRASLVVGLALIKQGMEPEEAIALIRSKRSPYALFNRSFADHLRSQSAQG